MATAIIGTLKHLPKASILPTLPETGRPNRIYFIPNEDPTEDNRYNEYLVELYLLKIMPMVIALAYLVNTVSSYFGVDIPILASIAGMSLIPLIFMYISSYVFKFCEYHRMFLHYIAVNDIINIYDWYIGISVTNRELFVLHMSITGISLNDGEHFTESEAMDLVSDMYHTEGGRKYSGEKFDIHKAKEICERYRGVIPVSATPTDVYVAINSRYHDYVELFKSRFGDNVDQKIIESAIIFWFKDVDCKSRNKVVSYFKEY